MSEFKGTPAPWEVKKDDDQWRIRQKGTVKRGLGFTVERPVAEGFLRKEDAKLAAAAPDLLEALQNLLADYQSLSDSGDAGNLDIENSEVGKAAYAAVAKALAK